MATQFDNALQELYVAYFNRPADPAGLAFYAGHLAAGTVKIEAIAADFAQSTEYKTEYSQSTNEQIVDRIYQNLFGHPADAGGKKLYADALTAKTMTIDQAVTWISNGAQGTDAEAFEAKVTVATAFTNQLATGTEADIKAYNTKEGLAAAKALISTIKTEEDAEAAVVPATLAASIDKVVDAGTPFTLAAAVAGVLESQEAKSDMLADLAEEEAVAKALGSNDDPTDADILAAITSVDTAAKAAINAIIPTFANTSTSAAMRTALLSDKTTALNTALTNANKALTAAEDEVADVANLGDAIAAYQEAVADATAANKANALALTAQTSAVANLGTLNSGTAAIAGTDLNVTISGVTTAVATYDATEKEWSVADGIDADDFEGLTAAVTALNAKVAAQAAADAANAAEAEAEIAADILDSADDNVLLAAVAGKMVFTPLDEEELPTYQMILAEQAIFEDKIDALDAVAGGAGAYATAMTTLANNVSAAADLAAVKVLTDAAVAKGYITTADVTKINAAFTADATTADDAVLANSWLGRSNAFNTAVTNLTTAEGLEAGVGALTDELEAQQLAVETAQKNIDALQDATADYNAAQALVKAVSDADKAIAAANKELTDEGYAATVALNSSIVLSTAKDDIFLVGSQQDAQIRSFGVLGQDTLYVGTSLKYNSTVIGSGTGETDLEDAGDNAVLEFFLNETATGVEVIIENKSFGSESGAAADLNIITLVGVDLEDITVANGFITVGTPA